MVLLTCQHCTKMTVWQLNVQAMNIYSYVQQCSVKCFSLHSRVSKSDRHLNLPSHHRNDLHNRTSMQSPIDISLLSLQDAAANQTVAKLTSSFHLHRSFTVQNFLSTTTTTTTTTNSLKYDTSEHYNM